MLYLCLLNDNQDSVKKRLSQILVNYFAEKMQCYPFHNKIII